MNPTAEIRNSEPGGFGGEIAIAQKQRGSEIAGIPRDTAQGSAFAPHRTLYELRRQSVGSGVLISSGMLTQTNLSKNRDTVLIAGKDWLHYLQRRIYPFDPELYVSDRGWIQWPRLWPDTRGVYGPRDFVANPTLADYMRKIDVAIIVRELILAMKYEPPQIIEDPADYPRGSQWPAGVGTMLGVPDIRQNLKETGQETSYKIFPGDSTTIFDHITKLSEQVEKGFEFDILPENLEFKLWSPRKHPSTTPIYTFQPTTEEATGMIEGFDWTNEGPDATYLVGLGTHGKKVGAVWTDLDNVDVFGRLDAVHDFGEVSDPDMLLDMLKDQNDLHPQRKLELELLNPEFMTPNFYTGGRPRNLIGGSVHVIAAFQPYRTVNAVFRVNAINWRVDGSTNEYAALELEMVYDP